MQLWTEMGCMVAASNDPCDLLTTLPDQSVRQAWWSG